MKIDRSLDLNWSLKVIFNADYETKEIENEKKEIFHFLEMYACHLNVFVQWIAYEVIF